MGGERLSFRVDWVLAVYCLRSGWAPPLARRASLLLTLLERLNPFASNSSIHQKRGISLPGIRTRVARNPAPKASP